MEYEWHYIKNGDLPQPNDELHAYLVAYKEWLGGYRLIDIGLYHNSDKSWSVRSRFQPNVYAWAEVPDVPEEN